MKKKIENVKLFFRENEFIFLSMVALVVVGWSSFSFGLVKGAELKKSPVQISECSSKAIVCAQEKSFSASVFDKSNKKDTECAYVGSVNGKKFYPPTCPNVKRINPKNLTCFISEKDALDRGYTRTKSCKY